MEGGTSMHRIDEWIQEFTSEFLLCSALPREFMGPGPN